MALTGTYLRTLDEKKRLALPKRLRDDFGDPELTSLMVAPGTEKSLVVYSPQGFDAFAAKLASGASHQNYVRLFYSSAERVELDGQGRMRIPERLAEYAGLRKEAYLLGVQDHAELWDKEAWDSFVSRHTPAFDELALKAMGG
ncbi:MAG: division/cell wall cluster transcriptional repressor MraZ [Planctomycetota bacterium]|jgi:MraZ protein